MICVGLGFVVAGQSTVTDSLAIYVQCVGSTYNNIHTHNNSYNTSQQRDRQTSRQTERNTDRQNHRSKTAKIKLSYKL